MPPIPPPRIPPDLQSAFEDPRIPTILHGVDDSLQEICPLDIGFIVFIFNAPGNLGFVSSLPKELVVKLMADFVDKES